MRTVEQDQDTRELGLPPSVQEALGELVSAAKDGLLALSVGVGLGVLSEKIIGYADLAKLANAVERDITARRASVQTTTDEEPATSRPSADHHRIATTNFHDGRDNLQRAPG